MKPSGHTFSGSVIRIGHQSSEDPKVVWESWFLSFLPERQEAERMFDQIYQRTKTRWWRFDAWDFIDAAKDEPAMIYQRRIATDVPPLEFFHGYFEGPYTLQTDFDPYASSTKGFDPAKRGSVEARARELDLYRLADQASDDDPWYNVETAYEHYAARTLLAVGNSYVEAIWLFSTGFDDVPEQVLRAAVDREAERFGAQVLGIVGPYPANESALISTGMRVFRAYRRFDGGIEEFESKIVDMSDWTST